MPIESVLSWLSANEDDSIGRLIEWLRMPSISTDPAYRDDVRRAGQWAADQLTGAGLDATLVPTGTADAPGHPIVLAHCSGSGPHVLFYGHYDVQPADPLDLWDSPPFEPVVLEADDRVPAARIVARGACDDKGQVMMFLEALRAWHETTGIAGGGARFTVLLEGEEESGSINLERFVDEHKEMLGACDVCVISDTGMLGRDRPAITYGVRGLAYTEVTLFGPDQDLHSGLWGGKCPNPINELTKVLAQLWDDDRRVTIPGFYDTVRPIADAERSAWAELGIDEAASLASIGLDPEASIGEAGYSFVEREWARPTCDINGIVGGYTGHGAKTVIPSSAMAKVSFRLVADQRPEQVVDAFFAWLDERTPPGCRWDKTDLGGGAPATVAVDSPYLAAARAAMEQACGAKVELIKSGGSIPVAGLLKERLGLETIFMGFGLEDDRIHSPNEKFEIECFRRGARSHALLIDRLRSMTEH